MQFLGSWKENKQVKEGKKANDNSYSQLTNQGPAPTSSSFFYVICIRVRSFGLFFLISRDFYASLPFLESQGLENHQKKDVQFRNLDYPFMMLISFILFFFSF